MPPNEPLAICQNLISTSNAQKSKIPRSAGKRFELMKINYVVALIGKGMIRKIGDILKKVSQRNPNSKIYPFGSRQTESVGTRA